MYKPTITRTITSLALPLALITGCGDAEPTGEDQVENLHIAVTDLQIISSDAPHVLHPLIVSVSAELTGDAYRTELVIGMRTADGSEGCVLGAMPVEHSDAEPALEDEQAAVAGMYEATAEFVVGGDCLDLAERDDVELFASFDPWNKLGDNASDAASVGEEGLALYSIVEASALSVEGCETCETTYSVHAWPGLDAELTELNLSSVVAVLPVAAEGRGVPAHGSNQAAFSLTMGSRVTGLRSGQGLDEAGLYSTHRIRPLGSSDEGLPLLQRSSGDLEELAAIPVPSSGSVISSAMLHIEGPTRDEIIDGAWAGIEEFELLTCLEADFDQAIYAGETDVRANDCAAIPVVIVRERLGADGLPVPTPGAAKMRSADVWGNSWGANAGYGFGHSGLSFETWVDVNGSDTASQTHKGITVYDPGSWFEAGVDATAEVFGNDINLIDIYATFIAYDWGGGGVAMGASLFLTDFVEPFEIQIADGIPVSLQQMFDIAGLDVDPTLTTSVSLVGVNFDDGCGSVDAGLWVEGTIGIDTDETTVTASTTDQGIKVAATVTPFFNIAAMAGATVNYSEYLSGGITATLNLLTLSVPFTASVEMIDLAPLDAMQLKFNEHAGANLTTLSGDITFDINYKIPWPACWSNCKKDHSHTIATWNGLNTYIEFFNLTQTIGSGSEAPSDGWCPYSAASIYPGDFNGDGATDMLCHGTYGDKRIDFSEGGEFDGTDWELLDTLWCNNGKQLLVGDFKGRGKEDLLCHSSTDIEVDYAGAQGYFNGTNWALNTTWCTDVGDALTTEDVNNDGRDDLHCQNDNGRDWVDYADVNGEFGGTDDVISNGFCDLYDGQTIALKTAHNRYVRALSGAADYDVRQASSNGTSEKFVVECNAGQAALRTKINWYLRAEEDELLNGITQASDIGTWETFTPVLQSNGKWAFRTAHNRYMSAREYWAPLFWDMSHVDTIGSWEKYTVLPQ